ncbi:MAG: response regulator [Bacteroidales bacterium]|nr:response regulator [Bacteroidales bacterium]MBN2697820.1 response regulator [Bacteroidales bacterium]
MVRNYFISAFALLIILLLNGLTIYSINKRFVDFLNNTLTTQTQLSGNFMESTLMQFDSDVNSELSKYDYSKIFDDPAQFKIATQSLRLFYTKYRNLISNISLYDNKNNFYGLYLESSDKFSREDRFVIDSFPRKTQKRLYPRTLVEQVNSRMNYYYPYFDYENDVLSGNVFVEVDFGKFAREIFSLYPIGTVLHYQWVISSEGELVMHNFKTDSVTIGALPVIQDSIKAEWHGIIHHPVIYPDGSRELLFSSFYPVSIYGKKMAIAFSTGRSKFFNFFLNQNLLVAIITFMATIALIAFLLVTLSKQRKKEETLKRSETVFRQVIEQFPVGIMILDERNVIRNINSMAQKMLFMEESENLIGKDFSKEFQISNRYLLQEGPQSILDDAHYLYYEKDGIETVIYRREKETDIGGEQLKLIALIDVSPIEKARKQEVAANKSKSDFLAAMSHEIRTPLNGILGMVDSLLKSESDNQQKEKLSIVRRSSELMMNIINDLLDFSKIEAGRMMLEEIPFKLSEEIRLVGELFGPVAEKKGLVLHTALSPDVPDHLIGDPFRLRQVISNLVSNAVKFTERGKIVIGTKLIEVFKGNVNILVYVEDTGVGIPKEKIRDIFGSYVQAGASVSRKYGGTGLGITIARQLVELMNGEIWVESPSSIVEDFDYPGSRFSFTFEAYSNEKLKKPFNFEDITRIDQINALILTKESDPSKSPVSKWLNKFGINVVTRIYQESTIESIIHHIDVKRKLYQMVFIIDRAKLDGFTLAHQLKDSGLVDSFPVVMITSNNKPGNFKICKKLGIDYYLIEPFENREMYDILTECFPGIRGKVALEPVLNRLPESLSILLAEDNFINQRVAQTIFKNIGYEIDIAGNGTEAVNLVKQKSYDIVFMDLLMPELDGFQAAEQIRKAGITTPIIALSADADEKRKADAFLAGMDEFLPKPVKVESIKQLLIKRFSTSIP